jgi:hypothetical protein
VENPIPTQNTGKNIYAQGVESDITCYESFTNRLANGNTGGRFRAGLTDRQITRFWSKVQPADGCWLWQGARFKNGYGMFNAGRWPDGRTDVRYAHRVVWELHRGPIPQGQVIRHQCDVRHCVNPSHLLLGTQAENIADAQIQGKYRGTKPHLWKLPGDVRQRIAAEGRRGPRGTIARLAREHGVSLMYVYPLVRRMEATHG